MSTTAYAGFSCPSCGWILTLANKRPDGKFECPSSRCGRVSEPSEVLAPDV